jgi:hypothetical protein
MQALPALQLVGMHAAACSFVESAIEQVNLAE